MGTKYLADQNQLVFKYESGTYAVSSGASFNWIGLVQDHTPDEEVNTVSVRYQGSTDRNVDAFSDGPLDYTGTFQYFPQDWKFLGFALGKITDAGSPSPYTHTIVEANSDDANRHIGSQSLTSFTLEDSKKTATIGENFIRTFNGCMIDTFDLNMTEGEIVNVEIGYRAQNADFSSGAVTPVTPTTTTPITWSDVEIQMPSGTTFANVTEFNLSISNNLEARFPLNGSRTIDVPLPLNREYEVSATFLMDVINAKTLYDQYFIGGSTFNAMTKVEASAGSLYLIMSGCKITDMEVPSPVEGLHEQTMTMIPLSISAEAHDTTQYYNAGRYSA